MVPSKGMGVSQYRGYYLEQLIREMMRSTGYIEVQSGEIQGRGADHQIDSYGFLSIPTPFVHPIRLMAEVKWYNREVGLPNMRDFVGVLKDISENYFVPEAIRRRLDSTECLEERYTDCGVFFSANGFTKPAQHYAWAHNIYLVPLDKNDQYHPVLLVADKIISDEYDRNGGRATKQSIFDTARSDIENNDDLVEAMGRISSYVGLVDGVYPTFVFSKGTIPYSVDSPDELSLRSDERVDVGIVKYSDIEVGSPTVGFNFGLERVPFSFSLPSLIANRLIKYIRETREDEPFSYILLIVSMRIGGSEVTRYFRINLSLSKHEKKRILHASEMLKG